MTAPAKTSSSPFSLDATPVWVLVAESQSVHAEAISEALQAASFKVQFRVVKSLREYREAVRERLPSIALVEYQLPDGCADEILPALPEADAFPVLILASHGNEQTAVQVIKAGALDYLVKSPETYASLPRLLERALREWHLLQSHRHAVAALKESKVIFQQFMDHSPIYVFFKDENLRSLNLSRNFEEMLGKPLSELLGKSMDELFPSEFAKKMIVDDKRIMAGNKPVVVNEAFGGRFFTTIKFPIHAESGARYLAGYTIDVTERHLTEEALRLKNAELEEALKKVKTLSGLLPICSGCKKIRDDGGYWNQVECYISQHTEATFTHGLCPECIKRYFPDYAEGASDPNPPSGPA